MLGINFMKCIRLGFHVYAPFLAGVQPWDIKNDFMSAWQSPWKRAGDRGNGRELISWVC